MTKSTYILPFLFCLIGICLPAISQETLSKYIKNEDRFNAGLVIGTNIAQIDGDYFTGYDKYGFVGGIKGIVRILPRLDFNMELLYSKKGSKIPSGNKVGNDFVKDRIIDLTYMEVPFTFKWLTRNLVNSMHLEAGLVYSRLIDQSITEQFEDTSNKFLYASIIDDFEKDDLAAMGGIGFTWNNRWTLHGRFAYSFTRFYEEEEFTQPQGYSPFALPVEFLRNYQVSLQLSYALF